jgi:hypothetical protein
MAGPSTYKEHCNRVAETDKRPNNKFASNVRADSRP